MKASWETFLAMIAPVLADVERDHPGLVHLQPLEDPDWNATMWGPPGTGGTGMYFSWGYEDDPYARAGLADDVQEVVIEVLWLSGRNDTTWPECPRHPRSHPLAAGVVEGVEHWVCPRTDEPVAPIGSWRA